MKVELLQNLFRIRLHIIRTGMLEALGSESDRMNDAKER